MRFALVAVAAALVTTLAGCGPAPSTDTQAADNTPPAPTPAPPPPDPQQLAQTERPAGQASLEALLKRVDDAEESSGNAINDEASFMQAYHAYCTKMQKLETVQQWTAVIRDIYAADPSSDTSKNPSIHLVTPGGLEVFQELAPGSSLLKTVTTMKEGDYVKFSIKVSHMEPDVPGMVYDECHDPDYHSAKGPLVNKFIGGEVTSLTLIS